MFGTVAQVLFVLQTVSPPCFVLEDLELIAFWPLSAPGVCPLLLLLLLPLRARGCDGLLFCLDIFLAVSSVQFSFVRTCAPPCG